MRTVLALAFVVLLAASIHAQAPLTGERTIGTVVAWGRNLEGQSTVPANLTGVVAIAAGGTRSLALKADGTVVAWGDQATVPANLAGVVAIASGGSHDLALKADGTVVWWTRGGSAVIADGAVAISAGGDQSLVLKADGTVVNRGGEVQAGGVIAIAAGHDHSLALRADGTVIAWGNNVFGKTTVPTNLVGVVAVAAGEAHSLALKADGTVVAWGYNGDGQSTVPENLTDVVAISASGRHSLALKADETVVAWGWGRDGQTAVPAGMDGVIAVAAGWYHSLALRDAGIRVFADGSPVRSRSASTRGFARIELFSPFDNGTLLYTVDGSDPSISARLYDSPFLVRRSAILRAITYNADFTQSVQSDPVEIIILPTLSATTGGGGSAAVDPPTGAYFSDGSALVTATPAPGWTFLQWLGDASGAGAITRVDMSRDKCVQAVFGTALTNTVVGSGSVVINPAGELHPYGSTIRLTAVPQAENYFALWGNAASGTNNPLTFKVANPNQTVTAVFAALPSNQHALSLTPEGSGQVTVNPCANRYGNGTNVTLTAVPDEGQSFLGWNGDTSSTNNPLVVTMNQSRVITANFTRRPLLTPQLCGGELQLLITGVAGEKYSVETATNAMFNIWTVVGAATNSFGAAQFIDIIATNASRHLYRARVE